MRWMPLFTVLILFLTLTNTSFAEITLCKESTVRHEPRADVTHGSSPVVVPDPVMVPITVDMVERYDLNLREGTQAEAFIGMMEVYKDGRILYDGRDISGDIKDICENDPSEFETLIEQESQNGD